VVAAVVIPGEAKNMPEEAGAFAGIFWRWWDPVLLGFWPKRVVGRGFLVVKLWWIAGESWEVDG
jgi:hypothetical protein